MQTPIGTRKSSMGVGHMMMTSDRKRAPPTEDKKLLQSYINRITEYVKHVRELGKDFISKGGLRSMSAREFVIIINYIIKLIVPKAQFTSNYSDELFQYLTKLEYPYSVNKSWFKTPNAPHSFNHIVIMLNFLLDFLPLGDDLSEDQADYANDTGNGLDFDHEYNTLERTIHNPDFPNVDFTNEFNRNVMTGYQLWAKCQEAEFQELKQFMENKLIRSSNTAKNRAELEQKIDTLKLEYDALNKTRVNKPDDKEKTKLQQAVLERKQQIELMSEHIRATQVKNEKLCRELQDLDMELESLVADNGRLEQVVQRQAAQRLREHSEEMSHQFAVLNNELNRQQSLIDQLNQVHYNKMLVHTRLVDEKSNLHNALLIKLLDLKEVEAVCEALELSDIDVNFVFSVDRLERLKHVLTTFGSTVVRNNQAELNAIATQINDLTNFKIAYQEGALETLEAKMDELNERIKAVQAEVVDATLDLEKKFADLNGEQEQLEVHIVQLKRTQEKLQQELVALESDKDDTIKRTLAQMEYINTEKAKNLERFDRAVDGLAEAVHLLNRDVDEDAHK